MNFVRSLTIVATLLWLTPAFAHSGSTAYIDSAIADGNVTLTWRIALRDLDLIADIDVDKNGTLTAEEVVAGAATVQALASRAVQVKNDQAPCPLTADTPSLTKDSEHEFAAITLRGACAGALTLSYSAFVGIDDKHRALARVPGKAEPQVLAPGASLALTTDGDTPGSFTQFLAQGVGHILGGIDHLLFLVALMLPSVLRREHGHWRPQSDMKSALIHVVWLATAFTIAHSITLGLAAFGIVRFSPAVIEPLVAVTVLAAALNNIRPVVTRHLAGIAFAFGLIHGFAFAEILAPLNLPRGELALALLGFNLGVEAGQIMVVATCFALLVLAVRWSGYPRWVLRGGSTVVAALACVWIVERVFDVAILS